MPDLLGEERLEQSPIVANSRMNRDRELTGPNGYARELALDPLAFLLARLVSRAHVAWLDLCCGAGRALIAAAREVAAAGLGERVSLIGVDLVPLFAPRSADHPFLRLIGASVVGWQPERRFDLITCVHGLHYVGDKLGLLERAAGWLEEDGLLLAHLDFDNLRLAGDAAGRGEFRRALRERGFTYHAHRRLLSYQGHRAVRFPYRYLGADDQAGPNYTGQAAVHSFYAREGRS